jgi:hypothetical protein
MRDFQRQRVYDWERKTIAPLTARKVSFESAQTFVNGVWLKSGWLYPPTVGLMAKHATRVFANGTREHINIRENTPVWVILHELAHTLTEGDGHGPDFVGMYIKLLDEVLNIPVPMSMYTLTKEKIKFNLSAQPRWSAS